MSPCTAAELAALRTPAGAYRGVYRHESGRSAQAWRAEPVKRVRLGTYRTAREAAAACADWWAAELGPDWAAAVPAAVPPGRPVAKWTGRRWRAVRCGPGGGFAPCWWGDGPGRVACFPPLPGCTYYHTRADALAGRRQYIERAVGRLFAPLFPDPAGVPPARPRFPARAA